MLRCIVNRQGKAHEGIEERMQSANEAWWKDVKIHRSKDVPWRVKCRRMVEHVYSVFCLEVKNWSWTQKTLDRIRGSETKAMNRLFRFKREKDEAWSDYHARTCRMARKRWGKNGFTFFCLR